MLRHGRVLPTEATFGLTFLTLEMNVLMYTAHQDQLIGDLVRYRVVGEGELGEDCPRTHKRIRQDRPG